ncbi:Uncharacterised protein [uncultured archaeon]|nr:Uncharacterised protein [uncultured archaeon]
MPRISEKLRGTRKNYYFSYETIEKIIYGADLNHISYSAFISIIINQWFENFNPDDLIQKIDASLLKLENEKNELFQKREEAVNRKKQYDHWNKIKGAKRPEAIKILVRHLSEGRAPNEIENTARVWAGILNCSASDLVFEANAIFNGDKQKSPIV